MYQVPESVRSRCLVSGVRGHEVSGSIRYQKNQEIAEKIRHRVLRIRSQVSGTVHHERNSR